MSPGQAEGRGVDMMQSQFFRRDAFFTENMRVRVWARVYKNIKVLKNLLLYVIIYNNNTEFSRLRKVRHLIIAHTHAHTPGG
jgi:hypothetical protein